MSEPIFIPKPGQIDFTNIRRAPVVNCIIEYQGKALIVQRSSDLRFYPNFWNGISGFLDMQDQTVLDKVKEELREELGIPESAVVSIYEGKVLEQEAKDYDKVWIVHPVRVVVSTDQITLDWEAQNFKWIDPKDIKNYQTLPGFMEVVQELYPGV
jgi:isopentenyldiphosphate isomerase